MLSIRCKQGKIEMTDAGVLQAKQFNKARWQSSATDVIGFTSQPGAMHTLDVTIHTNTGAHTEEMVSKADFAKLQAAFPHLATQTAGKAWYESPTALTHVETYTKEKQMRKEVEEAARHGWMIGAQSAGQSKASSMAMLGGAIVAGPVGVLVGANRSKKNQTTVSFVRTPEWLAAHRQS